MFVFSTRRRNLIHLLFVSLAALMLVGTALHAQDDGSTQTKAAKTAQPSKKSVPGEEPETKTKVKEKLGDFLEFHTPKGNRGEVRVDSYGNLLQTTFSKEGKKIKENRLLIDGSSNTQEFDANGKLTDCSSQDQFGNKNSFFKMGNPNGGFFSIWSTRIKVTSLAGDDDQPAQSKTFEQIWVLGDKGNILPYFLQEVTEYSGRSLHQPARTLIFKEDQKSPIKEIKYRPDHSRMELCIDPDGVITSAETISDKGQTSKIALPKGQVWLGDPYGHLTKDLLKQAEYLIAPAKQ